MPQLVFNWKVSGKEAASVFWMIPGAGTTMEDLEAVRDEYQTNIRAIQHTETELVSLVAQGPTPTVLSVGGFGTMSGQPSPPNSCYLVDKNMAIGRRGRWFLPGLAEDDTFGNGTLGPVRVAAVTSACNVFLTNIDDGTRSLAIQRSLGIVESIGSFSCQNLIGVQRRRLRR